MSSALVPPGYRPVLLGQALRLEDLGALFPLEESTEEGALILLRLDFNERPSEEALAKLNQACFAREVPPWPGNEYIVYADAVSPSIYLAWQKGQAQLLVIISLIAVTTILPVVLGGLVWWLIPQSVKDLITGIINLGIMLLMLWLMSTLMKPLLSTIQEKPRKVKSAQEYPKKLEEAQK